MTVILGQSGEPSCRGPALGHVALCVAGAPLADHIRASPPEHGALLLFPPGDEGKVPSWKPEDRQ